MNKRIKELLNQAGIYQPDRFDAIDGSNQMEKFAELIVRECVDMCNKAADNQADKIAPLITDKFFIQGYKEQAAKLGTEIKQHFGVE